jgi:hypothetical protein
LEVVTGRVETLELERRNWGEAVKLNELNSLPKGAPEAREQPEHGSAKTDHRTNIYKADGSIV